MQDWKMTDKMSRVENAGQENDGQTNNFVAVVN